MSPPSPCDVLFGFGTAARVSDNPAHRYLVVCAPVSEAR
jgi:hypothetical protein